MDIASLSMGMAKFNTQQVVAYKVLGQALDTQEMAAEGLVKMMDAASMELSVNPHIGANFDMSV